MISTDFAFKNNTNKQLTSNFYIYNIRKKYLINLIDGFRPVTTDPAKSYFYKLSRTRIYQFINIRPKSAVQIIHHNIHYEI